MKPSPTFFDHRVQFHRPSIVKDEETRREERTFSHVGSVVDAGVQSDTRNLVVLAPGKAEVGRWNVYVPVGVVEVHEGDVCEVLQGPESERTIEVHEAYRPRGRFQQLRCQNWEGALGDAS